MRYTLSHWKMHKGYIFCTHLLSGTRAHTSHTLCARTYTHAFKWSQWLNSSGDMIIIHTCTHIVSMPRESHFRYETAMCMLAARGGQLPTLQYLRATGWQWDGTTCEGAASRGHIKVKKEGCFVCVCACVRECICWKVYMFSDLTLCFWVVGQPLEISIKSNCYAVLGAEVGAWERLRVVSFRVRERRLVRATRSVAVCARKWMPVGIWTVLRKQCCCEVKYHQMTVTKHHRLYCAYRNRCNLSY